MKLLITLVTYERILYTKKTLYNLWNSISDDADYFIVVVDNNSTDGTQKYLKDLQKRGRLNMVIFNPDNYYPGKACNIGWSAGLEVYEPTHLMRLDNDMKLTKGWDKLAAEYFKAIPELGQLGIEHEAIETPKAESSMRMVNGKVINEWPGVVGGPMIMPRKLWDAGARYDETPWHSSEPNTPAQQEDSKLSQQIKGMGYLVGHAQEELGRTFANKDNWREYPDYYKKTMSERGYSYLLKEIDNG